MKSSSSHLLIIAGEASGDKHAASLVEAIRSLQPHITFSGLGGPEMKSQGVHLYEDLTQWAVVGFLEVIKYLPLFKKFFDLVLKKAFETEAQAVILVDYPGFNLQLAKALKKRGIKVIYYISPQVWAWDENRVEIIKTCVDQMLVLFTFEKDFYARHGYQVEIVGHPLLDQIEVKSTRETFLKQLGLEPGNMTLGILPGSRQNEVKRHLPVMLKAAQILKEQFPQLQFLLPRAPTIKREQLEKICSLHHLPISIIEDQYYECINACDICVVGSGTATLETAILQKPMVVIYKTSFLSWLLARLFIKIPYIGLVNVVAGKKIVPECIQFEATPYHIAFGIEKFIKDIPLRESTIKKLSQVKSLLGQPGASQRAATAIVNMLRS